MIRNGTSTTAKRTRSLAPWHAEAERLTTLRSRTRDGGAHLRRQSKFRVSNSCHDLGGGEQRRRNRAAADASYGTAVGPARAHSDARRSSFRDSRSARSAGLQSQQFAQLRLWLAGRRQRVQPLLVCAPRGCRRRRLVPPDRRWRTRQLLRDAKRRASAVLRAAESHGQAVAAPIVCALARGLRCREEERHLSYGKS